MPLITRIFPPAVSKYNKLHPLFALTVWLVVSLFYAEAFAGMEGTHHDMRLYSEDADEGVCLYCHVPYGEESEEGLFSRLAPNTEALGAVAAFCYYSCHDGTVVPTALVEGPDGSLGLDVLLNSHGFNVDRLEVVSAGMEDAGNVNASGAFDGLVGDTATLDCISCHNPHSNEHPPFLNKPLDELCKSCHSGVDKMGYGRWTLPEDSGEDDIAHPINVKVVPTAELDGESFASGMSFHEPHYVFNVDTPTTVELQSVEVHWSTGGHLLGSEKKVDCATCHSAHMPSRRLLVSAAADEPDNVLCGGCHGPKDNPANPGLTRWYHPVLDESVPPYVHEHADHAAENPELPSEGYIELFVTVPTDFPIRDDGGLLCTSCHTVHGGVAGAKCLRAGPTEWLGGVICNDCHGTGSLFQRKNMHHPVSPENEHEFLGFPELAGWALGPGLPGDLTDGLQCTDCHTEWAKNAHNW